jgi:hypothetical protein
LEFDLETSTLLNLGSGSEVLFIHGAEDVDIRRSPESTKRRGGDQEFLESLTTLPEISREVGTRLLMLVRAQLPGELRFHPNSKKFVETPDNYWVVRIQPRDKSFRIVVFGDEFRHPKYRSIKLVADMRSYSAFKLERLEQLADTIQAIKMAQKLKNT